jgi:heat shock protein HslJ
MTTSREFSVGELATTKVMCRNMAQEQQFFDMLAMVTHYEIDRDMLLLLSNGTLVAILQAR